MIDQKIGWMGVSVAEGILGSVGRARDEFETLDAIIVRGIDLFYLEGNDLVEFVRRCIYALLDAGARPFTGPIDSPPSFHPTDEWGTTREEIADSLIREWQRKGGGELEWWSYPFAFVEDYYPDGWPEPKR